MSNLFQALAQRAVRPAAIRPRARSLFEGPALPVSNPEVDTDVDGAIPGPVRTQATADSSRYAEIEPGIASRVSKQESKDQPAPARLDIDHREKVLRETPHERREVVTREERILAAKSPPTENSDFRPRESVPTFSPALPATPPPVTEVRHEVHHQSKVTVPAEISRPSATLLPSPTPLLIPRAASLTPPPTFSSLEKRRDHSTAAAPPAIRVTIGRVEVRAELPSSPAPAAAAASRKANPVISLEEYLRQNAVPRQKS